ncbi:quercetin dioxygenase-like cupin family protein [Microbacterium sp. AK009]|uniref:cupin domain-containing protein n=1 Tax=Microbacterium sp. AK009 TaxID=2723068 RepID=UPI0015C98E25|nr:cupin domain-containing protein [Microbacterium sp. AK009]NYF15578.1 quercetin dioxygenase-like cupin family protein [Microbacterium sp. AK009]
MTRHTPHRRGAIAAALATLAALTLALGGCAAESTIASTTVDAPTMSVEATPEASIVPPVAATDVATGELDEPVEVSVAPGAEGVGVTFREITLQPGAGTGEHCHAGQLIAVVKEGALTHYAPTHPDGVRVYETGEAIIEGAEYIHQGVNEGDIPVVLWVTYVIPEGEPLAETDLANCG